MDVKLSVAAAILPEYPAITERTEPLWQFGNVGGLFISCPNNSWWSIQIKYIDHIFFSQIVSESTL